MTPEEAQKYKDFAMDLMILHDRHKRFVDETTKDNIDISNKIMNLYIMVQAEIRKHTKQEED